MSPPDPRNMPDGRGGTRAIASKKDDPQTRVTETSFWQRVGAAAEAYNKFHRIYATDHQLTSEEEAAAVYLEVLNIRTFYPKEIGGPERYDALCKMVWEWFEKNKNT